MPNTLAHLGVQTLLGRTVQPQSDIKWILLGCVIPDISWILQVIGRSVLPQSALIDLRLYALVQSSLIFCVILAAALASVSRTPARTFLTLAVAVALHMLLDATQTKWGNGVLLFAPFNWHLMNFNLYWPEDWPSYALTVLGAITIAVLWWRLGPAPLHRFRPPPGRIAAAGLLLLIWVAGPPLFMATAEARNLHNTAVLRPDATRPGHAFTVDRNPAVIAADGTVTLRSWTGETFTLTGNVPTSNALISLKGTFTTQTEIDVLALRYHQDGPREWFSYIGLLLVLGWWFHAASLRFRNVNDS